MPVQVNELHALDPTEFTDVLDAMIVKMLLFRAGMQEIADKKIEDFTNGDLTNIPVHLRKAREFKKVIAILGEVAILNLTKMSYDQALTVVNILKNMTLEEKELDTLVKRFQDWKIASSNF